MALQGAGKPGLPLSLWLWEQGRVFPLCGCLFFSSLKTMGWSKDFKGSFFFFNFLFIIYLLFLAVLGLRFCVTAFSSCGERGPLFIAVRGPVTIAASLVAEHRLQTRRLSNCGSRAQFLRGMWDLPRPGLEPVSPALAGRFSTTAPPGKPPKVLCNHTSLYTSLSSNWGKWLRSLLVLWG